MNGKHTAGPWKVGNVITDKSYPYQQLRAAVDAECLRAITCGKWIIATADGPTSNERDANAHLIASAPQLLEALKTAIRYLAHPDVLAVTNQMAMPGQLVLTRLYATIKAAEVKP